MKNLSLWTAFILLAVMAGAVAAQTPAPMVIKRWVSSNPADGVEPAFIPLRLLTTPYENLTLAQTEAIPTAAYDAFWQYVGAAAGPSDDKASKCLPPVISDLNESGIESVPAGSIEPAGAAMSFPVVVLGERIYQEPVWNVLHRRVETLAYLKVGQIVRNESSQPLAVNDVVTFLMGHGTATVSGKTFCSVAATSSAAAPAAGTAVTESKKFLLMGFLRGLQDRFLVTNEIYHYRVAGSKIYPAPGVSALNPEPIPLNKFFNALQ